MHVLPILLFSLIIVDYICSLQSSVTSPINPEIEVNCGQLLVQGYKSCKIYGNQNEKEYVGPSKQVFSDLFFGYIAYECDNTAGYLTSEFDCEKCDFECSEEVIRRESLTRHQEAIQFWSGTILGVFFAALICILIFKCLSPTLTTWLQFSQGQNSGTYAFDTSISTIDALPKEHSRTETKRNNDKPKKTLKSVITGLLMLKTTSGCDVMHYVSLNKTSCHGSGCSSITAEGNSTLIVSEGQEVCVADSFGEALLLRISEISVRARYEKAYYTSDYVIWDPLHGGDCCETHEECDTEDTKCFERIATKIPGELRNLTVHKECFSSVETGLPMRCFWLLPKKRQGPLYTVYKRTSLVSRVNFTVGLVGTDNASRSITVGSYDSPALLLGSTLFTVLDVSGNFPDFLLQFHDGFYYVNGSEVNEPKIGTFGDLQIALTGKGEEIYATEKGPQFCREEAFQPCNCQCNMPRTGSMIGQFLNGTRKYNRPDHFVLREPDSSVVDTYALMEGGKVRMRFGGEDLSELRKQNAECEFDFLMSFGCETCDGSSYLVLIAQNITTEGLMPFQSNCTFDRQSVKCDYEPTKLVLKERYRVCHIRLMSGREFLVEVEYHAFGSASGPNRKSNATERFITYSEAFEHLVTSETFTKAFSTTTVFCFVLGLIITVIIVIFRSQRNLRPQPEVNLLEL